MDQKTLAKQMEIIHDAKRPNIDDLVQEIFTDFMELHGDRLYGDDHAMCCGIARLNKTPVTVIGQRKGHTTQDNIDANFGMAHPEGFARHCVLQNRQRNSIVRSFALWILPVRSAV